MNPIFGRAMGMLRSRGATSNTGFRQKPPHKGGMGGHPLGASDHDGDEPSAASGGGLMARLRGRVKKVKPKGGTAPGMMMGRMRSPMAD